MYVHHGSHVKFQDNHDGSASLLWSSDSPSSSPSEAPGGQQPSIFPSSVGQQFPVSFWKWHALLALQVAEMACGFETTLSSSVQQARSVPAAEGQHMPLIPSFAQALLSSHAPIVVMWRVT